MSQSKVVLRRGSRDRLAPWPVRWAVWVLYVQVLLGLATVLEAVLVASPSGTFALNEAIGIGVPAVLAPLVRRGFRWARRAVWIWAALVTVSLGIVEIGRAWGRTEILPAVSILIFPVGVSVLLALPSSNLYFRRT